MSGANSAFMSTGVKPITPKEIASRKKRLLPDAVIEAWNDCIAKHWTGSRSNFTIEDVIGFLHHHRCIAYKRNIDRLDQETMDTWRKEYFRDKFFDVEDVYRETGWEVDYDRPGYNEFYEANWTFSYG